MSQRGEAGEFPVFIYTAIHLDVISGSNKAGSNTLQTCSWDCRWVLWKSAHSAQRVYIVQRVREVQIPSSLMSEEDVLDLPGTGALRVEKRSHQRAGKHAHGRAWRLVVTWAVARKAAHDMSLDTLKALTWDMICFAVPSLQIELVWKSVQARHRHFQLRQVHVLGQDAGNG
jgi:hypothetical protein